MPANRLSKPHKKRHPPTAQLKFIVAMAIVVVGTPLGDVLLKRGMNMVKLPATSSLSTIPQAALEVLTNIWVDIGILLMIVQFLAFARALRMAPYSVVIPLRACSYIFTAVFALYILHEQVKPMRWVGILIVLFGVAIVGLSTRRR
jgi:drug/metabolite transporter (DMT)-like permease